jgi:hypothetical protein
MKPNPLALGYRGAGEDDRLDEIFVEGPSAALATIRNGPQKFRLNAGAITGRRRPPILRGDILVTATVGLKRPSPTLRPEPRR